MLIVHKILIAMIKQNYVNGCSLSIGLSQTNHLITKEINCWYTTWGFRGELFNANWMMLAFS